MTDPMLKPERPRPNRDRREYDHFHETLVTPVPATYRSHTPPRLSDVSPAARVVRFLAGLLILLLVVRFVITYFNLSNAGDWRTFFFLTTDWLVTPFHHWFGESSVIATHAFIDWAVLAAIAATAIVTWVIWAALRPKARY